MEVPHAFVISKVALDAEGIPLNNEDIDHMTRKQRCPFFLVPEGKGLGTTLTATQLSRPHRRRRSFLLEVDVVIIGDLSEQEALDIEEAGQRKTEGWVGRAWKRTGAGSRVGKEPGTFATTLTVYKNVITLIRSGHLGFNSDLEPNVIARIKEMYPWADEKKYWLKPSFDSHERKRAYDSNRQAEKRKQARRGDSCDDDSSDDELQSS